MKSIRTDNIKVTAQDLGVKVGDKFIVLPKEDCFLQHSAKNFKVGSILEFVEDDCTIDPIFKCIETGEEDYEYFSCLACYEDQDGNNFIMDKAKFDMKAIAGNLGVSLEEAHNIVQSMLFEEGYTLVDGSRNVFYSKDYEILWLFLENGRIRFNIYNDVDNEPSFATYGVKIEKSFFMLDSPEIIEVDGKKYQRID